jgi:hypothetical protein
MDVRILDLDSGVVPQRDLCTRYQAEVVGMSTWGPRIRLACDFFRFAYFEQALQKQLGDAGVEPPMLTFYGSGDFHHVSLALLRRLRGPFNLLVLDNHPDWMRRVPFLHCGTWLYHAARLPQVHRVFHVGGDVDFDNFYRVLAPWQMLHRGKIVVIPAIRPYHVGPWASIPNAPLRDPPQAPLRPSVLRDQLIPYREELAQLPLYISLDKDVMLSAESIVNWDSGHLTLDEVREVLTAFIDTARGNLIGMDILGDWSPVHVDSLFRWMFHMTMHPSLDVTPGEAKQVNERTNLTLVETVRGCVGARRQAG